MGGVDSFGSNDDALRVYGINIRYTGKRHRIRSVTKPEAIWNFFQNTLPYQNTAAAEFLLDIPVEDFVKFMQNVI